MPYSHSLYAQHGTHLLSIPPKTTPLQQLAHLPQKGGLKLCQITSNQVEVPQGNGKGLKDHQDYQKTC